MDIMAVSSHLRKVRRDLGGRQMSAGTSGKDPHKQSQFDLKVLEMLVEEVLSEDRVRGTSCSDNIQCHLPQTTTVWTETVLSCWATFTVAWRSIKAGLSYSRWKET